MKRTWPCKAALLLPQNPFVDSFADTAGIVASTLHSSSTFPPPLRVHESTANDHDASAARPIDNKVDGGPALLLRDKNVKKRTQIGLLL